jgi:GT2 family glycosyltransferase
MSLPARLNEAVRHSKYPCLVFLDDAVDVGEGAWVGELVGPLQQDAVALVGPKLLNPTTTLFHHAGIVFNRDGTPDYIFSGEPEHVCEVFGGGYWYRNWSAISGACFAIRRNVWERLGGFPESPEYPRLDIDLCMRAQIEGDFRIFYNPFARFHQLQDALLEKWLSPGGAGAGAGFIRSRFPSGDPYFHPQL